MNHGGVEATFTEEGVWVENHDQGDQQAFFFWPSAREDAHAYAFILRKCAQHLERVGRGLPTKAEVDELNTKIMCSTTTETR
jgi:hypothetical protein